MRIPAFFLSTLLLLIPTFLSAPAACQSTSSAQSDSDNNSVEGTVVSSTRNTLVVKGDDNQYHLFTYDNDSVRVRSLAAGARVRVAAGSADENGTRVATNVTVLEASTSTSASSAAGGTKAAPVPPKIREIESDIKREGRRWRAGVRAGAGFDPELLLFGVQSQIGPIFHPRVFFRPNAEFAFGEVTDLVALNLEAVYRIPSARSQKWSPYVGAGPSLTFIHQNFEKGREIDFGNFDYETGFNVLAGLQFRKGMFVELKSSLYSGPAPKLRLIFGYNF